MFTLPFWLDHYAGDIENNFKWMLLKLFRGFEYKIAGTLWPVIWWLLYKSIYKTDKKKKKNGNFLGCPVTLPKSKITSLRPIENSDDLSHQLELFYKIKCPFGMLAARFYTFKNLWVPGTDMWTITSKSNQFN